MYLRAEAFVFGSFAALLLATGAAYAAGPTQAELNNAASESANWPYVDHDYRGQRYTPLDQITAKNATDLAQVLQPHLPPQGAHATAPIVYDGTLYATTAHYTLALDGASCKVVWQSEWKPRYLTGSVTRDGTINFRDDVYKHDDVLDRNAVADAAVGGFVAPVLPPRDVKQVSTLDSR